MLRLRRLSPGDECGNAGHRRCVRLSARSNESRPERGAEGFEPRLDGGADGLPSVPGRVAGSSVEGAEGAELLENQVDLGLPERADGGRQLGQPGGLHRSLAEGRIDGP
ncbi:hypothetical protein HRbin29_01511 [bacterium HR29]|jgi:hypothetical protein|nr:hypothetical protein HRbin29_01511 [bacterium HR29]